MKQSVMLFLTLLIFILIAACTTTYPETEDNNGFEAAPTENPDQIVGIYDVIYALQNPDEWVVVDVRTVEEFNGKSQLPNAYGSGRISGAINVDRESVTDADGNVLSREELMALFDFIGNRKVIVYCHGGIRSAFVKQVLTDIGFYAFNYVGSWIDWSRAASVANGGPNAVVLSLTEAWTDNEGEI